MDGPPYVCPTCLSKYRTIHGMIFPEGSSEGYLCQDAWHPHKKWELSDADLKMLKACHISTE